MKFASARRIITPETPIYQGGYIAQRNHPYEKVHDDVEATSFCLDFEGKKVCFVGVDVVGLNEKVIEKTFAKIAVTHPELGEDNVMFNVSHDHCSPATNPDPIANSNVMAPPWYVEFLTDRLAETVCESAEAEGVEVTARFCNMIIDGIYSNRNNINKPSNKNLNILGLFHDGRLEGMMVNLSHHCTVLGPNYYELSADLFGCMRRELEKEYGTVVNMIQGTAGDMGNRQYRQGNDYNEVERETANLLEQIRYRLKWEDVSLAYPEVTEITYHCAYDHDPASYDGKIADFEKRLESEKDFDMIKLLQSGLSGMKRKQLKPAGHYEAEMKASIWNMGDFQLVLIPGEIGSILGLRIKEASDSRCCLVFGYTNGSALGYMVEAQAFSEFSQEVNVTEWPEGIADEYVQTIIDGLGKE